jgi:aryl-phospho-beta-D-glucosidase BglC (GH1 family)
VTPVQSSYLHSKGSKLYNDKEQVVRLTGVNWFGFETSNLGPHGLWVRDYHGMLLQIKSMGFNCIRIPFCDAMLRDGAKVQSINFFGEDPFYPRDKTLLNKELEGFTPIEILDEIIRYAGELGLAIILDNHSREPDGYMNEKIWYTQITSEQQWIDDWVMLAKRYKGNPTVTGFDLENEPHAKTKDGGSTWATGNLATDWNVAAQKCGNAILAVNPDALIIIEGVEQFDSTMYWWGGNLRGVKKNPIVLSKPAKLVYSAHEYGPEVFQQPWFEDSNFPKNMEAIWDGAFGFVVKDNTAPLLVGEFGIKDMKSYDGKAGTWFTTFLKYMADNSYSWTFWCFNPNSGDTGGLLSYDWQTVEQWKLDALKPWCAPLVNEPASVRPTVGRKSPNNKMLTILNNQITCNIKTSGTFNLEIINLSGQIVVSTTKFPLSLKTISSGTYTAVLRKNYKVVEFLRFAIN